MNIDALVIGIQSVAYKEKNYYKTILYLYNGNSYAP